MEAVHDVLAPDRLIGCGAGGVIALGREIEAGTAVSVWAAALGEDGSATTFHASVEEVEEGTGALTGMADLAGAAGAVLLADPVTFPTDAVLRFLSESTPMLPLLGGLASGRSLDDETVLFIDDRVVGEGAVGVRFDGVEVLPMVSQGAAPIGPELTITAGEGHVIGELAGKPALEKLKRDDRGARRPRTCGWCRAGCWSASWSTPTSPTTCRATSSSAASSAPTRHRPGGDRRRRPPRPGRPAPRPRRRERRPRPPRGAGAAHDRARRPPAGGRAACSPATAAAAACSARRPRRRGRSSDALAGAPAAGFFAAGEIGPVGGGYFLHSFTATVAVFA